MAAVANAAMLKKTDLHIPILLVFVRPQNTAVRDPGSTIQGPYQSTSCHSFSAPASRCQSDLKPGTTLICPECSETIRMPATSLTSASPRAARKARRDDDFDDGREAGDVRRGASSRRGRNEDEYDDEPPRRRARKDARKSTN